MTDKAAENRAALAQERLRIEPTSNPQANPDIRQAVALEHIAMSLWRIAEAMQENNRLIGHLGFEGPRDAPGGLEKLATEVASLVRTVDEVAAAVIPRDA